MKSDYSVINLVYTSCPTSGRMTKELELRKDQENQKNS